MDTESEFDSDSYFTSDESEVEIESDDGEEVNATDWHSVDNEAEADRDRIGSFEFLGTPGLNPAIDAPDEVENSIPFFLRIFLSEATFAMLANWTNAKAWASVEAVDGEGDGLGRNLATWRDCSASEMKKLIGMYLYMGLNNRSEMKQYWSTDVFYSVPFFQLPEALSRDRFMQLLGFLRFYDCAQQPDQDPLFKIRPFLNSSVTTCKNVYRPTENVSVDESLVKYKGRLRFKQYISTKRAKCGIKLYCACESSSGYSVQHTHAFNCRSQPPFCF